MYHPSNPQTHRKRDPVLKSQVRSFCYGITSDIQPLQNLRILNMVAELGGDKPTWARTHISKGFEALEKILETSSGKYCFGDSLTVADCCLVPQVYNADRFQVDMSKFPNIKRIYAELQELPQFKQAHPSAQPDAVVE